eukprot:Gb_26771 [translate_table: standard]
MDFNKDERSPNAKEMRKDSPSDVEEFLALLERIEATQKALCFNGRPFKWTTREICGLETSDKTVGIKSAPSWKPAFEWEDFSPTPLGKDIKCNIPSKALSVITNPKENEGTQPAKCLKIFSSRLQDTKLPAQLGLDLNVELPAEHLFSGELRDLFPG